MALPPGELGKYELIRRIGVGGLAEVYEARLRGAAGFSKRLAIKILLPDHAREQSTINSFIDEASIASSLTHPNIVPVYDFGEIDWDEFNRVINGNGMCNRQRVAHHIKAHEDGAWVRDAIAAYESKKSRRAGAAAAQGEMSCQTI